MPRREKFAALILTHGRPDRVYTAAALEKHGYTGPVFFVVDDEDRTRGEYVARYGAARVLTFSKAAIAETFDEGDNFGDRRAIVYARNASFELARAAGVRYFVQLDDDYTDFRFKITPTGGFTDRAPIWNLDAVFAEMVAFLRSTPFLAVSMAQGGDFFGGRAGFDGWKMPRKCMNSFVCDVERPFQFFGRINEDVNTYTAGARRGMLFATCRAVALQQKMTQTNAGGMTELYLDSGTYFKSFYSVMFAPSCVKIGEMGRTSRRIHHRIDWTATAPKIVAPKWRKAGGRRPAEGGAR